MSPDDPRHGTNAGYIAHRKAGETACRPCLDGRATYQRRRDYDRQLGRPRTVPSLGAQRRIQALQRLGWSLNVIAAEGGWSNGAQDLWYALHSDSCNRRTWLRIAEVFERLCMTTPPISSGSVRARNRAIRLGYAPPLAWDDIDNDETPSGHVTSAEDSIDPVVVDRLLDGKRIPATRAERTEALRRWVAQGRSQRSLCAMHGWQEGRYKIREDAA